MSHVTRRFGNELSSPTTASRMSEDEIQCMMIYVCRSTRIFAQAVAELKPELFSPASEGWAQLLLKALQNYYEQYRTLPPQQLLQVEVSRAYGAMEGAYSPHTMSTAETVIRTAFTPDAEEAINGQPNYGVDLLYRFLYERIVSTGLTNAVRSVPVGMIAGNVRELLNQLEVVQNRVETIRTPSASPLFSADGPQPVEMPEIIKTGVPFLDDQVFRNGNGCQAGKVYGLFGPWGSFKTGLGVQICVSAAEAQLQKEKPGLIVYCVYEGGEQEIRNRAIAAGAEMPKETVEAYFRSDCNPIHLSTRHSLKEYEVRRYDECGRPHAARLGELERLQALQSRMSNLFIKDMSGPDKNPGAGSGYIPEIVATLERLESDTGQPIRMVVIDYAKEVARRYLNATKKRPEELRHLLSNMTQLVRMTIANRFGCAVWLLQQLNAQANKKAVGAAQHHADSGEAGDFAENLWYAITISSVDWSANRESGDGMLQLNVTKSRDSAGQVEPMVLRLDRTYSKLVSDNNFVSGFNGRIVSRDMRNMLQGPATDQQAHAAPPAASNAPNPAEADG